MINKVALLIAGALHEPDTRAFLGLLAARGLRNHVSPLCRHKFWGARQFRPCGSPSWAVHQECLIECKSRCDQHRDYPQYSLYELLRRFSQFLPHDTRPGRNPYRLTID